MDILFEFMTVIESGGLLNHVKTSSLHYTRRCNACKYSIR
nr:MAG TPA: hypothetical protein [Caudoviricetes sp.]